MDLLASEVVSKNTKKHSAKNLKRLLKNDSKKTKARIISIFNSDEDAKKSKKLKADNSMEKMSFKKKKLIKSYLDKQKTENTDSPNKVIKSVVKEKSSKEIKKSLKLKEAEPKKIKQKLQKNKPNKDKNVLKNDPVLKNKTKLTTNSAAAGKNSKNKLKDETNKKSKLKDTILKKKPKSKIRKVLKEVKGQSIQSINLKLEETITGKKNKSSQVKKNLENIKPVQNVKVKQTAGKANINSKKRKQDVETEVQHCILKKKEVLKYVTALLKVVESEEKKKTLFDSEKPIVFLHINCLKIAKVPLHQQRIILPHSMVSPTDEVALFVKDLKKGRKIDYENTKHYYEDFLQKHGCKQIKTIIPFNQVKTEYSQFEMKKRLLGSYDYFLIDGKISGHMSSVLGKTFREKRKLPNPIHMETKNLKAEIDLALKKTTLQIHGNGDSYIVQVGTFSMDVNKIADNIIAVVEELSQKFPGGWENIRSLRIKTPLSIAIPIYMTLKSKNDVEVPKISPKRPKAYKDVEGELSTLASNVKVIVSPDGTVITQKMDNGDDSDGDIDDDIDDGGGDSNKESDNNEED